MNHYPLTSCHFLVDWGAERLDVAEVSGLSIEFDKITYRNGNSVDSSSLVLPGNMKNKSIFLKRGIVVGRNEFYEWLRTIEFNTVERRDLRISLLNEKHEPVVTWKVRNAFPIKLEWSDLKANTREPAFEVLEVEHEGISLDI